MAPLRGGAGEAPLAKEQRLTLDMLRGTRS